MKRKEQSKSHFKLENKIIFNNDVKSNFLVEKKIGIIGYGNQGRAQSLNLKDSALEVMVGLRNDSKSIDKIKQDNISYDTIENAVCWADIVSVLVPDKLMPHVYYKYIQLHLKEGQTLLFSHGFNVHYNLIKVPSNINVIMVAPSGGGALVRNKYKEGSGVPSLLAVDQDFTGDSLLLVKSYSKAIGSTRVCSFISTFKEETETDLFGEQVLLTGGIPHIIDKSLKVLIDAGYSPVVAWFVCYYEIKTIIDLFHDKGIEYLYGAISDTAKYGGIKTGKYLMDDDMENKIKSVLKKIQSGEFSKELQNTDISEVNYKSEINSKDKEKINKIFESVFKNK